MKLIIVGEAASGKDYLKTRLKDSGKKIEVSFTTREKREGERDGVDYHFINRKKFEHEILCCHMLEWIEFGGNYYGTSIWEWSTSDVFIKTPDSIANMGDKTRKESLVMYLNVDEKIRMLRLVHRGWSEEKINERILLDNKLFKGFKNYDMKITDPFF